MGEDHILCQNSVSHWKFYAYDPLLFTRVNRTSSVGRGLDCKREVAGSIPGAGPILRVLKKLRNEGTPFALQTAGPSHGSDDHAEMAVPSPVGDVKIVSPIKTFVLNTPTLKKCIFFSGIALLTDNILHLHYNEIEHECEAISGKNDKIARNCLVSTLNCIVMRMSKVICEKGYCIFIYNRTRC